MKKYLFLVCTLAMCATTWAQQIPMMTQAQVNPFLLNPAYAGNSDYTSAFLHARSMWSGMPDAPQQYILTADGALNNGKVGLGLMLYSDVQPIIRNMGAMLTYRYKIRLGGTHFLSGALSGGFLQNSLDFEKAIVENPEELADFRGRWSKFNFNLGAGLLYQFKGLEVGATVKQLTNAPFTYDNTTTENSLTYRLIRHYELSATYNWRFTEGFALKPLFVAQSIEGMPFNFMLNACVSYLDNYWIGVGYKLESAYSIIAGLTIADKLLVGYSCDIAAASQRTQFGLTHEISIGYRFGRQSTKATPSENISRNKETRIYDVLQQQSEDIDRLKQTNRTLQKQLNEQESAENSRNAEQQQLLEIYARERAFMDSLMIAYSVSMDSISDEALQARQHFVVLGAYYKLTDAKIFQKILERELGLETKIVVSNNGTYYFVYSKIIASHKEANAEFKRLIDMGIQKHVQGNLWIYSNE